MHSEASVVANVNDDAASVLNRDNTSLWRVKDPYGELHYLGPPLD